MQSATTTIPVQKATREKLKGFGAKGDSYDDILRQLMEIAEERAFFDRQLQILRKSKFHALDEV